MDGLKNLKTGESTASISVIYGGIGVCILK
jgi:hypothetical protein